MARLAPAVHGWSPGLLVPSVPSVEAEPVRGPVLPGERPEELQVAVATFPGGLLRGLLPWARIEQYSARARNLGGNELRISVPCTPEVMRILGTPVAGATDQAGRPLYHGKRAGQLELVVGSTLDGLARRRFVVRDDVSFSSSRVTVSAVGFVGGVTGDRVIGAPTRRNLISSNASFEQGTLAGWRAVGGCEAEIASGGPDGGSYVRIRGPVGAYLERRVLYSQPVRPWGRQRISGQALVKLPGAGLDIDEFGLASIAVFEGDTEVWPGSADDEEAAVVTSEMARGEWIQGPVVAVGYLPTPPYDAIVCLRLYPVDETEWTSFDDASIFRRENTSTVDAVDLVRHPGRLFDHAQRGREKSTWGIEVVTGTASGIVERGTWWHEDGEPLGSALEAIAGRGVDIWDLPGPGRRVKVAARQGAVRSDVRINAADVLGKISWRIDAGSQRTSLRAVSQAGSLWGGADEGLTDTSRSGGQVIDLILSAPVGMTPTQVKAWLATQMKSYSAVPAGTVLLVGWDLGHRVEVGDTVPVALQAGSAAHHDWMRITEWAPDRGRRFVALSVGTDPLEGIA